MIGIDLQISRLNTKIGTKFGTGFTAHGRAYVNSRGEQSIPEYLNSGTNEYDEVLLDSAIKGKCFFVVENDYENVTDTLLKTNVYIYFAVNLVKLYPTVSERAVEYLHRDVLNLIKASSFENKAIESGKESFKDFSKVKDSDDMQPYYLCRFKTEIEFNINEC